jgi:hypothetical protein
LKPSEINPTPAAAQQYAEAMADFNEQFSKDPKQDPMELARKVVQRHAIMDFQSLVVAAPMPSPKYVVGGRNAMDVKETRRRITADFMKKHAGDKEAVKRDKEYQTELRRLKVFEDAYARRTEAMEAVGKQAQ